MASTITLKSDAYKTRYMQLTCSQAKNEATNKSTITWILSSVGGEVNYYSTGPTSVYINGTRVYYKDRVNYTAEVFPAAKGEVKDTITIDHNADGKKTISVSMSTAIYNGASSAKTYSANWELDPIPRGASIVSVPSSFTNASPPTITYNNPAGNNVKSLEACIEDSAGQVRYVPLKSINKTGTLSYTFSSDDMKLLNDVVGELGSEVKSLAVKFYVRTETSDGKVYWSGKPSTFNMVATNDTKPKVSIRLTANHPSGTPSTFAGVYVQGKTAVDGFFDAYGEYYADISSYELIVGGVSYKSTEDIVTSDTITKPGSIKVVGKVTDTRGFPGETTEQTITVLEYSKPLVVPIGGASAILCYRSDGNGKRVGNSTSVWIKAKRSYYSLGGKNKCALQWRYKNSKDTWNDNDHKWADLIPNTTTSTDEYNALVSGEFSLTESYSVQIRAIDTWKEYDRKDLEIPTRDVALHLGAGGKNVSIGEYCDYSKEYTFRSAWDAYFDGNVYRKAEGSEKWLLEDGIEEQGESGIWRYRKWRNGMAECWCEYILQPSNTGTNSITVAYPFTMTTIPVVQITPGTNSTLCSRITNCDGGGNNNNRNEQLSMLVSGVTQTAYRIGINVYVISSWK